jgi:ABC-type microcin C transport system permease subunit YejE
MSHFNLKTPFSSAMFSVMAIASAGISVVVGYMGILFFSDKVAAIPEPYLWGIRMGIFLFVVFSLQGFAMGARLSHTVGAADGSQGLPIVNWSKTYGDLRIAHFLGMHALQILPILAYYVARNVKIVLIISLLYGIVTLAIFVQALQGKPLFR